MTQNPDSAATGRVEYDVPVPMRDGVILRADLYRPSAAPPAPVLVCRTPYNKRSPRHAQDATAMATRLLDMTYGIFETGCRLRWCYSNPSCHLPT